MKKLSTVIILTLIIHFTNAQTSPTLEKNLASVDVGFLGAWLTYERQLAGNLTLNSRLGLEGVFLAEAEISTMSSPP